MAAVDETEAAEETEGAPATGLRRRRWWRKAEVAPVVEEGGSGGQAVRKRRGAESAAVDETEAAEETKGAPAIGLWRRRRRGLRWRRKVEAAGQAVRK